MKTAIAALFMLLAATLASTPSRADTPGCFIHPDSGVMYCIDATLCNSPRVYDPIARACQLPVAAPPAAISVPYCTITISYPEGQPNSAAATVPAWCDPGRAEIAVAQALTRQLATP